jgi:hypothetical protein
MKIRVQHLLCCGVSAICVAAAVAPLPASAAPVMEMQAEDMLRVASHVKESLALSTNQQTLWQQVASRSGALLRVRLSRREKLQADLKTGLGDPGQDLRNLSARIDAEALASAAEDRELRDLWLGVGDALTDQQRQLVAQFMLSQLERVAAPERAPGAGAERGEAAHQGGKRRNHQPLL